MSYYCYDNVRTPQQAAVMRSLEERGLCLFCPDGLRHHQQQQILFQTRHWSVTPNEFPYPGTALHLLLVPHEHAADLLDLPAGAQQDFWTALGLIRDRYQVRYYGLGVRNGDCRFTGATIRHVHAHVLVGNEDGTGGPVRMRFSARPGQPGRQPAPPGSA